MQKTSKNTIKHRTATGILLMVMAVFLVACGTAEQEALPTVVQIEEEASPTSPPPTTDDTTPEVDETTPEPVEQTPEAVDDTTPEANDSEVIIEVDESLQSDIPPSTTEDDAYFVTVTRLTAREEAEGQYILDATLANQTGPTVTVEAENLTLVDSEGNRYSPVPLPENFRPALVGSTLEEGDILRGVAQFELPDDIEISHVEWCLDRACETVLGAIVP